MNRYLVIALSCIVFSTVSATPLLAKEGDEVCLPQEQMEKMAVEVSDGRTSAELNVKYEALIDEQKTQIRNAEGQLGASLNVYNDALEQIEVNKKLTSDLDSSRLKEIAELKKPRWRSLL